jgi:putative metallohydrolase (TIGR04338 family)
MSQHDPDRRAVYRAEDAVTRLLDLVTPDHPTVLAHGSEFVPEPEARFSEPADVARHVERVLTHLVAHDHDFDGRQRVPVVVRERRGARSAHYETDTATLAIPPRRRDGAWALRELVVLHELAHHLCPPAPDRAAHGPEFRATCLRLLESVGSPVVAHLLQTSYAVEGLSGEAPSDADPRSLGRIAKLLRQAESTGNEAEREAFLAKAQELATTHSIALAVARAHGARSEERDRLTQRDVVLGERGRRGLSRYARLLLHVAEANDLKCTIRTDSTVVTLHGFESDAEMAEALFASLLVQMVEAGEQFLASGAHHQDRVDSWDPRRRRWVSKPVPTITARLNFYEAYGDRIGRRLREAREQAVERAVADERRRGERLPVGTALALRQKELAVHDHFEEALRRDRVRGTWRGATSDPDTRSRSAVQAGRRAAARADLGARRSRALPS